MDKRDKMMIIMLTEQMNFYGDAMTRARNLHEFAIHGMNDKLAVASQKAVDGLNELIDHFSLQQDAVMKRNGAVHIPIKSEKEIHEIHFKEIRTKHNPLW